MALRTDLFDFDLPAHLIAQQPCERRDQSRLLVVHRATRRWEHRLFSDLPHFVQTGDVLLRNRAAVLPARLHAVRPTGGAVECFLVRPEPSRGPNHWWCLLRPGKKLPVGATFAQGDLFTGQVVEKTDDGSTALVHFSIPDARSIEQIAEEVGNVPLPPYIARRGTADERAEDIKRYETVYADAGKRVAVAAPTAGLHFTEELLRQLVARGVEPADLILHVGLGTFKPITADLISEHEIHRELYEIPPATQTLLAQRGRRRIAVGTTSVRSVEDYLSRGRPAGEDTFFGEAGLFIYPPYSFRGVDALITNFHQPRSTLLCLVSAFLTPGATEGIEWLREIYADAIGHQYRFFSYGDAMLII